MDHYNINTNTDDEEKQIITSTSTRARYWCFTIFNRDRQYSWKDVYDNNTKIIRYLICGWEKCPTTKKMHWQCFCQCKVSCRLSQLRKLLGLPTGRFFKTTANAEQNIAYCKKDGDYLEFGTVSKQKKVGVAKSEKKLSQHERKKTLVDEEVEEAINSFYNADDKAHWIKKNGYLFSTYRTTILQFEKFSEQSKEKEYLKNWAQNITLLPHQQKLIKHLEKQSDRQVTWVIDINGCTGKSTTAKYLAATKNAFWITACSMRDFAFAYKRQPYVVFDLARSTQKIDYSLIEHIKNGCLFNSKYKSQPYYFIPPKLVLFANHSPILSNLTQNRWDIIDWSTFEIKTNSDIVNNDNNNNNNNILEEKEEKEKKEKKEEEEKEEKEEEENEDPFAVSLTDYNNNNDIENNIDINDLIDSKFYDIPSH